MSEKTQIQSFPNKELNSAPATEAPIVCAARVQNEDRRDRTLDLCLETSP